MSAQGIAARMVAKHGLFHATWLVENRYYVWSDVSRAGSNAAFMRASSRLTLWRAVSTALGRMEASV